MRLSSTYVHRALATVGNFIPTAVLNLLAGLMVTAPALPLLAIGTMIIVYVSPTPTPPGGARGTHEPVRAATAELGAAKAGSEAAPLTSAPSGRAVLSHGAV